MSRWIVLLVRAVFLLALSSVAAATSVRASTPNLPLLATYEPVTQFDPQEKFLPTAVESFLTDADLEQLTGSGWVVAQAHAAPGDLPLPGSGTWRVNQQGCTPPAPVGGLACYAAAADHERGPVVYGHVVQENGETILEYWFFYYDDVYSYTYPASDFIWQAHEGDWENVDVVLNAAEQPLYVGYSQHCSGQRRSWPDTARFDGTHPVVHVAVGSHANYFSAGTHPIKVACIPSQAVAVLHALGLPLPVDYAFAGPVAGPPGSGETAMPIEQLGNDNPNWLSFPGSWGELQYFHAPPPIGTVAGGSSPVGPAFHHEWTDPLGTLATWPASRA